MNVNHNHYVPCPEPSLTMDLAPHCNPNVVTVLADNGVCGLHARQRGGGGACWVDVEGSSRCRARSSSVNFGHQMEVVSDGALRGGEHRVVTNARDAGTSLATFVTPAMGCAVPAAPGMVPDGQLLSWAEVFGADSAEAGRPAR
ncbi:2'-deoxymugineic-acid 2'-dioxygenase-like [Panicum hallii]|jgi:2'-deoxymugineic-acid 2'-dioxygenase / mugineic-acid 3-dioxygenase|uniref:2'-deoxymugineic-acid 2'-dioxygenase-like n=1 Tax=Panicum hallii TaxID=206008 RepID=UPI000DF4D0FC|nr:2'-deoxymugineic-acid 2'-dioxygenase-like [Panicum hallii]